MFKKISIVMFASLFSVALAAGCKKDEKGGEGGGCEALGKKVVEDQKKEMGDVPPEMKKMAEEMLAKGAALVVTSCKEDKWSKEAIDCGLKSKDPEKECEKLLTDEQQKKMEERMEKAMGDMMGMPKDEDKGGDEGGGDEAGGDEAGGEGGGAATGLAECDAYVAAMEKYLACDKVPQEARDGAKQGLDAMKSGWGDTAGMPEEAKKAANDACKQAVDALKQGASAMGCEI